MNDKTSSSAEMQEPVQALAISEKKMIASHGFAVMPQNLGELLTFANMLASSDLVPKDYRGKPSNVMVAMQMGHEIGIQPMQAIQNIAVINGKPSIYGDLGKALLRSKGCDIEEADVEEIRKTGVAWCVITRPGQKPVKRTFSLEDAKTAQLTGKDGAWKTYPLRQMAWRAFWFAARDAAPDILKGIAGREEIEDYDPAPAQETEKKEIPDYSPKRKSEMIPVTASAIPATEAKPERTETKPIQQEETISENNPITETKAEEKKTNDPTVTPKQIEQLEILAAEMGVSISDISRHASSLLGARTLHDIAIKDLERIRQWIRSQIKKK